MSAGTVRSFHLTAANRLAYANGDTEGAPYTYSLFPYQKEYVVEGLSSDIVLYQGKGCNGQFDCTFEFRARVFVGVIDYCLKTPRDIEDTCFVDPAEGPPMHRARYAALSCKLVPEGDVCVSKIRCVSDMDYPT